MRNYIDFIRGIAVLGVILVHSSQNIEGVSSTLYNVANFGQMGVVLFFVASSYTLCLSSDKRGEKNWTNFYIRRFFRIAPLFYFAIIFYFLWKTFKLSMLNGYLTYPDYSYIGFIQTISFVNVLSPQYYNKLVPGAWSISTEMLFYLIFPFLYLNIKNKSKKERIVFCIIIIILMAALQAILIYVFLPFMNLEYYNNGYGFLYVQLFNMIGVFLIGMLTYFNDSIKASKSYLIFSVILIVFSYIIQSNQSFRFGMNGYLYPLLSAMSFSIFIVYISNLKDEYFNFSFISKLGVNSYSIYICHFFILDIIRYVMSASGFNEVINPDFLVLMTFVSTTLIVFKLSKYTVRYIELKGIDFGKKIISKSNIESAI